jgi:hypothetical protein
MESGVGGGVAVASNALVDLLSGKSPVAMYDALHAARLLSPDSLRSPAAVVELLRSTYRASRRRPLERVASALAGSGYLNEAGLDLHDRPT